MDGKGSSIFQQVLGFWITCWSKSAKHGGIDLIVKAQGDLEIDEHHTIEDVAITLGETFYRSSWF